MKVHRHRFITPALTLLFGAFLVGCEVETEPQPQKSYPQANHLVINEVYTLPGTEANAHSWIELYNPTQQPINLYRWALSFTTTRSRVAISIYYDSALVPVTNRFEVRLISDPTPAAYTVPIVSGDSIRVRRAGTSTVLATIPPAIVNRSLEVGPGEFFTLVSDIERLRIYNTIGPGGGPAPDSSPSLPVFGNTQGGFQINDFAQFQRDTANRRLETPDTVYGYIYQFFLGPSDQIVLRDSAGRAVDVVRYGNYTYAGPGADPFPTEKSLGAIPAFESIARYAGAYDTDNSSDDFYITRSTLRPIPHWLSQLYKR